MSRCLIILPVYNEAAVLADNARALVEDLRSRPRLDFTLVIADCSDRDATRQIAARLAREIPEIEHQEFPGGTGKGEKIRSVTLAQPEMDLYAFIDVDLPITFDELWAIVATVLDGEADVAVASKYVRGGGSRRIWHRGLASRLGNRALNLILRLPVHDFLAGAKAWNRLVTATLWPDVRDRQFFFDAELLYLAIRRGLRVREVPVTYVDHPGRRSTVNVFSLGLELLLKTGTLLLRR